MSRLAHHVFFALHDASAAAVDDLVAACQKYLVHHDGVVDFSVGRRDESLVRAVNDVDYDVSLHVIFRDRAAHDAYQTAEDHLTFIDSQKSNWKRVRVFDSLLET